MSQATPAARNAAILFEPEAYVLDGPKLMGRQAAGNAYLRAAVDGRCGEPLLAYTPRRASAEAFARLVSTIDPGAKAGWIPAGRLDRLAAVGSLYLPGPVMRDAAMLRLRVGPAAYSLTGVTHTTASHTAMDAIASLPTSPLMPWDALICTSRSVLATVDAVLRAEREYLSWRFGRDVGPPLPQLPVIPLGVHCRDFEADANERAKARSALGLREGEVAALFVGRLSFHAKAHPHAMYAALEAVARRTGRKLALIQCGWFANDAIEKAFKEGGRRYAPGVTSIYTDGRDAAARRRSWAAADIFVSLSDNIQETFGLAPVEAMAAGLPVVATDWDGYRDSVRDGIDGFLIPTSMPEQGHGEAFALSHETSEVNYDQYCALTCRTVSVDHEALANRLAELVLSSDLRSRLGASGYARARAELDWSVVYRRYQDLWAELAGIRAAAQGKADTKRLLAEAPRAASSRLDPMLTFAHYATRPIGSATRVRAMAGASIDTYRGLKQDALFGFLPDALPADDLVSPLLQEALRRSDSVSGIALRLRTDEARVIGAVAVLAKMGLVSLA